MNLKNTLVIWLMNCATYPNYVKELNKLYDVNQKLGGLIVKLGAGIYVALVFKAENVEEFIKTHGVK